MIAKETGGDRKSLADLFLESRQSDGNPPDLAAFFALHPGATPADRLEVVLHDQDRRGTEGCPRRPEEYFRDWPDLFNDPARRVDVVYNDYDLRRSLGEQVAIDDYFHRFPDLRDELDRQFMVADEWDSHSEAAPTIDHPAEARQVAGRPVEPATDPDAPLQISDFELIAPLDPGRIGSVYRAWRKSTQTYVALKFLPLRDEAPESVRISLEALRREVHAAGRLRHPRIVAVFGAGRIPEGRFFLVLELVHGPSLAERMKGGRITPKQAAAFVADVAEAIAHAHKMGVIHCDLKPANVLIDGEDRALVTDFGLSRRLIGDRPGLPHPSEISGTPPYMAPEQFDNSWGPVNERTDVYGLGALLYDLLADRPPFLGQTKLEILRQVAAMDAPPSPSSLKPKVPRGLEAICLRCLKKHRSDRYGSAEEVARELRRWLDVRRRHRRSALLATGLVLSGLVLAWWLSTREPIAPIEVTPEVVRLRGPGDYRNLTSRPESLARGDGLAIHTSLSRPAYLHHFRISTTGEVAYLDLGASRPLKGWSYPPKPWFEPVDGPPGTSVLVLIACDVPLSRAQADEVRRALRFPDRLEPLEQFPVLVDGLPAGERPKGGGLLVEPRVNEVLEAARKKLEADGRTVRILALRQDGTR